MTYKETIHFLYTQLPMYQRQGKVAYKKDLSNIIKLCDYLGNPQERFKSIHIAGTNGKGSVCHMTASVLQAYGHRVGLYTSPHYKDFRERIKINGKLIPKKEVVFFVEHIKTAIQEISPSFFEITVAMAFWYFAKSKLDYAVIETGLGGRLDSTNIINPILCGITNISFDHVAILGDTLAAIASEKAGIIKENTPLIVGEYDKETAAVFEKKAAKMNAELSFAEDSVTVLSGSQEADLKLQVHSFGNIQLSLPYDDPFLKKNVKTSLSLVAQLALLNEIKWDDERIADAYKYFPKTTYYIGRWMKLGERPLILADSAHNEAGLKAVLSKIKQLKKESVHIVIGFAKDKDLETALPLFPVNAKYYFAKANIPRGLDAKILKKSAALKGLKGRAYTSVKNAYKAAKRNATQKDLIYIGGSIFVVAEVI